MIETHQDSLEVVHIGQGRIETFGKILEIFIYFVGIVEQPFFTLFFLRRNKTDLKFGGFLEVQQTFILRTLKKDRVVDRSIGFL